MSTPLPPQAGSNRNTINHIPPHRQSQNQAYPIQQQGTQQNLSINQNLQVNSNLNQTIESYKQQLFEKQNEIQQLMRQKTSLEKEKMELQTQNQNLRQVINNNQNVFDKQLEEKQFQLSQIKSDQINYKGMKKTLEEQIEEVNKQRQKEQELHSQEIKSLRERQKTLIEDLQEQRRKYDHLHFYLERNAKQFEFEEEQLKTQIKIKDQELLTLEKQLEKLQAAYNQGSQDTQSNLVAENESLKFKLSEMAAKLNNYTDLERKFNQISQERKDLEVQQIEQKMRVEQERIITKRTIELEDQYNRLNQEVLYLRNREKQLQMENEDYRDKAKKMAETVNETIQQANLWKEKYQIAVSQQSGNQDLNVLRSTIQQKEMVIAQQESMLKNVTSELAVLKNDYSNRPSYVNSNAINVNGTAEVVQLQSENKMLAEMNQKLQDQIVEVQEETRKKSRNTQGGQQFQTTYVNNDPELIEKNTKLEIANRALSETVAELEFRLSRLGEPQPGKLGLPQSQRGSTYVYQTSSAIGGIFLLIVKHFQLTYSQKRSKLCKHNQPSSINIIINSTQQWIYKFIANSQYLNSTRSQYSPNLHLHFQCRWKYIRKLKLILILKYSLLIINNQLLLKFYFVLIFRNLQNLILDFLFLQNHLHLFIF
ncbi:transmembrane protein, putative (macronuclear) [Tetrahymena thermophila SB210]|uniref:Transmembrane protein, putative n=1 Tax=Tetrahymena thermophila (strain SB210) TaxID=312017 RepID=I7MKB2_TETTS|nr:transmembrane protein, putative [Tetrahymena thermophila SB210]EAR97998.2 transmembrane protein, putative [Tetrahymena thermophila SB210]|eukprot:XP_001018243.2 transmembrane protein, putative [Tetrahymena thermophila SB210]